MVTWDLPHTVGLDLVAEFREGGSMLVRLWPLARWAGSRPIAEIRMYRDGRRQGTASGSIAILRPGEYDAEVISIDSASGEKREAVIKRTRIELKSGTANYVDLR